MMTKVPLTYLGLAAVVPLLGGCDPFDDGGLFKARISYEANLDRWERAQVHDYVYEVTRFCFCPLTGPVEIVVLDGSVVEANVVETNAPVPIDDWQTPSVARLFALIDQGIHERWHRLDVMYDKELGYPRSIQADPWENAVDEEFSYEIGNLRPLILSAQ